MAVGESGPRSVMLYTCALAMGATLEIVTSTIRTNKIVRFMDPLQVSGLLGACLKQIRWGRLFCREGRCKIARTSCIVGLSRGRVNLIFLRWQGSNRF